MPDGPEVGLEVASACHSHVSLPQSTNGKGIKEN